MVQILETRTSEELVEEFITRFNEGGRIFQKRNEIAEAMGFTGYAYGDRPLPEEVRKMISRRGGSRMQKLARDARQRELFTEEAPKEMVRQAETVEYTLGLGVATKKKKKQSAKSGR